MFESGYKKRNVHHVSELWAFVVIFVVLILSLITKYNLREGLPKGIDSTGLHQTPNVFVAERAWKDLQILTSFGPRLTGTYSNEVLAVDFLKREASHIKQLAHKNQRIEIDVQVVSGEFWLDFKPHGSLNVYRNIQNVVVKLIGESQENNTLLLNCHHDTTPTSPGASDNASNCVVMLEILRILSRQKQRTKHTIIFLFNGAEENGLQGAHGFITKHKWAKDVKAFINLESVGSAAKELLFQTSPNNPWLVKMYGKSAPYPSAQVAAEEVFQSELIPSDTDFRIFRDFANLTGLDFAYTMNGYRYHTKFDHIDYLSKDVLQHTGENILELTKAIANADEIIIHQEEQDPQVFYDVFGLIFISYSMKTAAIFNYSVVSLSVLVSYLMLSSATRGINKKHLRYEIFLGFLVNMISLVASNALSYAIAYDLDKNGKSMSWFTNSFLCALTYGIVTVFVQCVANLIFNRNSNIPLSLGLQTQARLIGTSFFWGLLAAALTGAGIRTAYAIVLMLLITLCTNIITGVLGQHNSVRNWLYIHLIGQAFVVLWGTNLYHMVIDVFVPTAGRSGSNKNPDIMIAIICSTLTFFITSYLTPLVILFKKFKNFFIVLFSIYIVTRYYVINLTIYGFPYSDESLGEPKVQRHYITHTIRTLYDREGEVRYTDSGFWFIEYDRNSWKTIESLTMPEIPIPQNENILCKNEIFCGLPLYFCRQLVVGGYWVPAQGPPKFHDSAYLKLINNEKRSTNLHRLEFILAGGTPSVSLFIRPKDSVVLKHWSIFTEISPGVVFNDQLSYFVKIINGLESTPFNFTLDLETIDGDRRKSLVDIALVSTSFEYEKDYTPEFANMLAKMPRWSSTVSSVASFKMWTF